MKRGFIGSAALAVAVAAILSASPVAAQPENPPWLVTIEGMDLDPAAVGAGPFTAANIAAEDPFGDLEVAPVPAGLEAVGVFLAALSRDQAVELVQRCNVIVGNMVGYSVETVAFCNTIFDLLEPTDRAAASAGERTPGVAVQTGPGFMMMLEALRGPQALEGGAGVRLGFGPAAAVGPAMAAAGQMHGTALWLLMILLDTDGDGALSLAEVQAIQERIFRAFDMDANGLVTLEEIHARLMAGGGVSPAVGAAVDTGCKGGFTGGGTGVAITAGDHVLKWSQSTAGEPRVETDVGVDPQLAAEIRAALAEIGFNDIAFNEPGNMTCSLTYGGHTVAWPQGDARAPAAVLAIHERLMRAVAG